MLFDLKNKTNSPANNFQQKFEILNKNPHIWSASHIYWKELAKIIASHFYLIPISFLLLYSFSYKFP